MGGRMSFYTYSHSSPEGKVFYIGKGVDKRAYAFSDRSQNWKIAVIQHSGLKIDILANWETEAEAYEHEKFLIQCFKDMGHSLVNLTGGGKGPYQIVHSAESNKSRSEKCKGFVHKKVTCPTCGKTGGETSMKRWHFEKCSGTHQFRARITVNGKRIHIGRYTTRYEANKARILAYKELGVTSCQVS